VRPLFVVLRPEPIERPLLGTEAQARRLVPGLDLKKR
jgi:hypothetical protein